MAEQVKRRNAASKGGPKRKSSAGGERKADVIGLEGQLAEARAEVEKRRALADEAGWVQELRNGRRVASAEAQMYDKAVTHRLAVSNAYARVFGLPVEKEGKVVAVKDFQEAAKAGREKALGNA